MPHVAMRGHRGRRSMNEINMVPFIDVMLVLLIIFMVTAPLITTGVVDLPSVGKEGAPVTLRDIAARVGELQNGDANTPVVISADRNVKYEAVVKLMDTLQRAGIQRVGLSVKTVESHRAQIMERLGIHEVAGLTRYAIRNGLVSASA